MFEVSVKTYFSAAHRLVGYPGECAQLHGHNWEVEVFVRGHKLDKLGMLVDFRKLKAAVRDAVAGLDHCELNRLPAFARTNPSSENIAAFLHSRLSEKLEGPSRRISRVAVSESPGSSVSYSPAAHGRRRPKVHG